MCIRDRHLAANVECAASTMGNMIPPAGVIVAALACYNEFSETEMSQSAFWIVTWGVAFWFIIQRIVTLYVFCHIYKVKPMDKADIPSLSDTLKKGWKNLLLPVVILLPFVLDYMFKATFFTQRLGEGAADFSGSLLLFTPGMAMIYALLVSNKKLKIREMINLVKTSVTGIVPVAATIFFAYCISNLFTATDVGTAISVYIQSWNLPLVLLAFIIPLLTAILGMVLPGSAQTKIFGGTIISVFAVAGGNPLVAAVMLPAITGAMEGLSLIHI